MRYDPDVPPDPSEWLAAPEDERAEAVRRHHEHVRLPRGRAELHMVFHVAVENQLAAGHPAATAAMARLVGEGLGRHEALHAIGAVLAGDMLEIMKSGRPHDPVAYARELDALTAAAWRADNEP